MRHVASMIASCMQSFLLESVSSELYQSFDALFGSAANNGPTVEASVRCELGLPYDSGMVRPTQAMKAAPLDQSISRTDFQGIRMFNDDGYLVASVPYDIACKLQKTGEELLPLLEKPYDALVTHLLYHEEPVLIHARGSEQEMKTHIARLNNALVLDPPLTLVETAQGSAVQLTMDQYRTMEKDWYMSHEMREEAKIYPGVKPCLDPEQADRLPAEVKQAINRLLAPNDRFNAEVKADIHLGFSDGAILDRKETFERVQRRHSPLVAALFDGLYDRVKEACDAGQSRIRLPAAEVGMLCDALREPEGIYRSRKQPLTTYGAAGTVDVTLDNICRMNFDLVWPTVADDTFRHATSVLNEHFALKRPIVLEQDGGDTNVKISMRHYEDFQAAKSAIDAEKDMPHTHISAATVSPDSNVVAFRPKGHQNGV